MLNNFKSLENISSDKIPEELDSIISDIYPPIRDFLNLEPSFGHFKFSIEPEVSESKNIFNIGVKREIKDKILQIKISEKNCKYLPFILLREIYNLFTPVQLVDLRSNADLE